MKVNVINKSKNKLPEYAHYGDAGIDLRANIDEPITVHSKEIVLIPTGLYLRVPYGYELQVRSRSGMTLNNGVFVLNAPGTVDYGYSNEVGVILANFSSADFTVKPGDRIAQAVLNKIEFIEWNEVQKLDETERGKRGFGSTGKL